MVSIRENLANCVCTIQVWGKKNFGHSRTTVFKKKKEKLSTKCCEKKGVVLSKIVVVIYLTERVIG